jgi:8-oxo-dGTP diphosphatase
MGVKVTRFEEIDWANWQPVERATLLFVLRDGQLLLIHKKRGLGAGKINGPGGRIDPGETAEQCAVREVQEELRVTPIGLSQHGELMFQFADGFSIHGTVFRATGCEGTPEETDEAVPLWTPVDRIPYERMWADDRVWLPLMLRGHSFRGRFLFDGDTMLGYDVVTSDECQVSKEGSAP